MSCFQVRCQVAHLTVVIKLLFANSTGCHFFARERPDKMVPNRKLGTTRCHISATKQPNICTSTSQKKSRLGVKFYNTRNTQIAKCTVPVDLLVLRIISCSKSETPPLPAYSAFLCQPVTYVIRSTHVNACSYAQVHARSTSSFA